VGVATSDRAERGVARRLELDIAARHGVCANVEFTYLAQWLWRRSVAC
jgi:exonuclease V gamma subunit